MACIWIPKTTYNTSEFITPFQRSWMFEWVKKIRCNLMTFLASTISALSQFWIHIFELVRQVKDTKFYIKSEFTTEAEHLFT